MKADDGCTRCGAQDRMQRFENGAEAFDVGGLGVVLRGLKGYRCGACSAIEYDPDSARRLETAEQDLINDLEAACRQGE